MANLDVTDLLDVQSSNAFNDKRMTPLGILDLTVDSTPFANYILPSDREKFATFSSLRTNQLIVLKDQDIVVITTPGFEFIPSNLPETAKYSFTAVDVFSGFRHYPAQYENNAADEKQIKEMVMTNVLYEMGNKVEELVAIELEARKTQNITEGLVQVSQGVGGGAYTFATSILSVNKAAQQKTMFTSLNQVMTANKLPGNYKVAVSPAGLAVQLNELAQNGVNNAVNIQGLQQFTPDNTYESHNISAGSDVFNGWLVRNGAIAVYENFPSDFRRGTQFAGQTWSISPTALPFLRMRANIYTNNEATNATALVGAGTDSNMIMTHFQEMAIWLRFYIVYRYNEDLSTIENDIVKIKGTTT
jgi:hypothetical protein